MPVRRGRTGGGRAYIFTQAGLAQLKAIFATVTGSTPPPPLVPAIEVLTVDGTNVRTDAAATRDQESQERGTPHRETRHFKARILLPAPSDGSADTRIS